MYLQQLNQVEKENFLELATILANVDNELASEEKLQILQYRYEMHLHEEDYIIKNKKVDDILQKLSKCEKDIQKIITFELIGLAFSDQKLKVQETELLSIISKHFDINEELFNEMQDKIKSLQKIYLDVNELLSI